MGRREVLAAFSAAVGVLVPVMGLVRTVRGECHRLPVGWQRAVYRDMAGVILVGEVEFGNFGSGWRGSAVAGVGSLQRNMILDGGVVFLGRVFFGLA